jgi:hypothetical protein
MPERLRDIAATALVLFGPMRVAPHPPQNFSLASLEAPHCGQPRAIGAPHSEQNLRPSRFSPLHFEQRIS